jgi:hypothetical protein
MRVGVASRAPSSTHPSVLGEAWRLASGVRKKNAKLRLVPVVPERGRARTRPACAYGAPTRVSISAPQRAPIAAASATDRPLASPYVNPAANESPHP